MKIIVWIALLLAYSGCGSSPDTAFYSLAAVSGKMQQVSLGAIEVRRPGIAGYLDRSEILARWEGHRLRMTQSECWGEPIAQMIGRVLAEDLTDRLRGTLVFSASSDLSIQASTVVELAILKLDLDREGYVRLNALVSMRGQGQQSTRAVALQARPATTDTNALVATMSGLLGQLADEIATALIARGTTPEGAPATSESSQVR